MTDDILRQCKHIQKGVLLIVAPTGAGKTLGMHHLITRHPHVFGKTCFIQPTKMAAHSLGASTPQHWIITYLKDNHPKYDTLVMDEVHTQNVEYQTIFSILSRTRWYERIRVILMSATPSIEQLKVWFPITIYNPPIYHPFTISVQYEPFFYQNFPSYQQMATHTADMLKKYSNHDRVLVFLYTHEQCDKMAKDFAHHREGVNTRALYGGMDKTDIEEWLEFVRNNDKFIVFATNVAETSITIPNLSLVIDFGIRCIQRNNRIIYNQCPKFNLIQRAGRTGRTCSGVVLRCMTVDGFMVRPETDRPEYNWDLMVLLILRHGRDPTVLLPLELMIDKIMNKLRFYQIVNKNDNSLDMDRADFVLKCPLLLKNSCFLYNYMKRSQPPHQYGSMMALFVLSCALIDQMETRMSKIYYYSNDMRISRPRLLEKLKRVFGESDEMVFHINVVVSCLSDDRPSDFSNEFSLNFRTIRQISSTATRIWKFISADPTSCWSHHCICKDMSTDHIVFGLDRKKNHKVWRLTDTATDQLRHAYMMDPMVPRFMVVNDLIWRPNFILQYYNCIVSPFSQIYYNRNKCVLILSFDDEEVDKWFDPNQKLDDIMPLSFSLYLFLPQPIDEFISNIRLHVRIGCFKRKVYCRKKETTRKSFESVLQQINEEVAYRPGLWKMEQAMHDFCRNSQLLLPHHQ